jgi:hypothetical protein
MAKESTLYDLLFRVPLFQSDGVDLPRRSVVNVLGAVLSDNPDEETLVIDFTGGGGDPGSPGGSGNEMQYRINGTTFGGAANVLYVGGKLQFLASPQWKNSTFLGDLAWAPTANRTVTIPDATGIVVLNDNTATLSGKAISGSANTITNVSLSTGVTGILPTGNQAAQSMGGDCSGTTASCTVAKVNGISFTGTPAAGAVPRATSGTAAAWGAVDLANGNAVTGLLPGANMQAAAAGTNAGSMSSSDKTKLDGIQKQGATATPSTLGTTHTVDWAVASTHAKTLGAGANTLAFSNATDGQCVIVVLTGAASTVTWPTVKWAGGTVPTQTASGIDVYTFVKVGSTIYGSVVQAMA